MATWLLMKTQLLICKRYSAQIGKFQYPYGMLLKTLTNCLQIPVGTEICRPFTSVSGAKFLHTAVDLMYSSCLVSPLNAEELIREGGVAILENLLDSYISFLSSIHLHAEMSNDNELIILQMESAIHVVHTIAGVAYFESGRAALESLPNALRLCQNWRKCVDLQFIGSDMYGFNLMKRYALEGIMSMAKSKKIQILLASTGIMWNLIHSMLDYDPTLELTSLTSAKFETSIKQDELNYYGGVAARGVGMMCGVMEGEFISPSNSDLYSVVQQVLTKPIAKMLKSSDSENVLLTLNLSVKTPLRLWDMGMRKELLSFLTQMEVKDESLQDFKTHIDAANTFEYSNLADEMNIGGVYIRIFNSMDMEEATKEIQDISHFAVSLLAFLGRCILNDEENGWPMRKSPANLLQTEAVHGTSDQLDKYSVWYPINDERFIMCLEALLLLVKQDGLVDDVICKPFSARVIMILISLPYRKVRVFYQFRFEL